MTIFVAIFLLLIALCYLRLRFDFHFNLFDSRLIKNVAIYLTLFLSPFLSRYHRSCYFMIYHLSQLSST